MPPWGTEPARGPVLRIADAAAYYGVSISSYYEMVKTGEVPPPIKLGPRASGVPQCWLDAAIRARAGG